MQKLLTIIFTFLPLMTLSAQKETDRRWYIKSLTKDGVYGTAVTDAARLLKEKKPCTKKIIVAVIDSGTDVEHPYLDGYLWTNKNEIPNNHLDDDGNGYIDDIHGWSFVPDGPNGSPMVTPKYADFLSLKLIEILGNRPFNLEEQKQFDQLKLISNIPFLYEELSFYRFAYSLLNKIENSILKNMDERFINRRYLLQYLKANHENLLLKERNQIRTIATMIDSETPWGKWKSSMKFRMEEAEATFKEQQEKAMRDDRKFVGDDLSSLDDKQYGEAFLGGKNSTHGTHVAGTVVRMVKAIEEELKIKLPLQIMTLKAIPSGDEYDKDVALSIRYAVDNGASIINMSFGKTTTTHSKWVSKALDYAAKHDVLIIHAASNENRDLEKITYYPTPFDSKGRQRKNMLTIGASDPQGLPASFSNYGKNTIDFFAPGVDIYASVPGNSYTYMSGTSMAAPVVTGLTALVRIYYPELKAEAVKEAFTMSKKNTPAPEKFKQIKGKKGIHSYRDLSKGNGVIDFTNCIKWLDNLK